MYGSEKVKGDGQICMKLLSDVWLVPRTFGGDPDYDH